MVSVRHLCVGLVVNSFAIPRASYLRGPSQQVVFMTSDKSSFLVTTYDQLTATNAAATPRVASSSSVHPNAGVLQTSFLLRIVVDEEPRKVSPNMR